MTENSNENTTNTTADTAANGAAHGAEKGAEKGAVRDNLREAGDALLTAGSALGSAFGKFADGLPERFKSATDSARETLNSAKTEGEVRSWAANVTNEAEKAFTSFRERDVKFTDDAKASLRRSVTDVSENFNQRMDKLTNDEDGAIKEMRTRFDGLVDRIQAQFSNDDKAEDKSAKGDVIDGEVVETSETQEK